MMASIEAFVGIRMQNSGWGIHPSSNEEKTSPLRLRALTATNQDAPPSSF